MKNKLHSASDFKDAVVHYDKEQPEKASIPEKPEVTPLSSDSVEIIKIKPQTRDIKEYTKVFTQD